MASSNSDISAKVDIICRRGDTFQRSFTFTYNGLPANFAGVSFIGQVVDNQGFIIITFVPSVILNAVTIAKTDAQMKIPYGNYKYDIQQINPDGTRVTVIFGNFVVNNDITA